MVNYHVELLPAAEGDLENIFDYIMLEDPFAAEKMLNNIVSSLKRLETFPNSGIRISHKALAYYHFRMIVTEPYIAFYKVFEDTVFVYRILHGAWDYIDFLKPD